MQFNPPSIEPTIDPNSICRDFPELNKRQSSMCNKNPHATASAMQGNRIRVEAYNTLHIIESIPITPGLVVIRY